MLTCYLIHILSISTESRPVQISFSTSRSGLIASLSNDASYVTLYDIKETTHNLSDFGEISLDHLNNGFGGHGGGGAGSVPFNEKSGVGSGGSTFSFGNKIDEELDTPILWKSRRSLY